ncbi:MAG: DUF86 domain-containing protein [Flavobacteriales bacterium]|nr:DUF86 domain-containing protein [Flavobacteriales bacterium]
MSKRGDALLLADMLEAVERILRYTDGMALEDFAEDELVQDGVVRNFEIVGEASRHLSEDLRARYPAMDWRGIRDFRNILVHEYFGVDLGIIWHIIQRDLPQLRSWLDGQVQRKGG